MLNHFLNPICGFNIQYLGLVENGCRVVFLNEPEDIPKLSNLH